MCSFVLFARTCLVKNYGPEKTVQSNSFCLPMGKISQIFFSPKVNNLPMSSLFTEKLRDLQQERECTCLNYFKVFSNYIEQFSRLSWFTLLYKGLSWFISVYLGLFLTILVCVSLFQTILVYLGLSRSILVYLGLSWKISDYLGLSQTILDYFGQSWTT